MINKDFFYLPTIIIFSFFINFYSANIGVLPIDTFGFYDTGFLILKGQLPIRDYWAHTGLTVDYFQSIFFLLFGNNWNSYIFHSSLINVIATLTFYFFLLQIKVPKKFAVFYSLSFATLLYPVSGTPYAYLHAFALSTLGIMIFFIIYISKKNKFWTILPIIYFLSFFSMQTPTVYILISITFFSIFVIIKDKNYLMLKYLALGTLISFSILICYILLTNTNIQDFIYQYFLFPITIAEGRMGSELNAYVKFADQLNLKRIFGDFKFLHIFLIPLIIIGFIKVKNKKIDNDFYIILIFSVSTVLFIYNQLLQANQIYIFSLIPILAAILHKNLDNIYGKKIISFIILSLILFVSIKFHLRFNVDRKFIDLEKIDKSAAFQAKEINSNFKSLKWITPYSNPEKDKLLIKKAFNILAKEEENSLIITHYQFFSTMLDKKFYILNRWYIWDDNSHPTERHKYFDFYQSKVNKSIISNNIKVIYLIGEKEEILFEKVRNYFTNVCFESKTLVENRFSTHKIVNCKDKK